MSKIFAKYFEAVLSRISILILFSLCRYCLLNHCKRILPNKNHKQTKLRSYSIQVDWCIILLLNPCK